MPTCPCDGGSMERCPYPYLPLGPIGSPIGPNPIGLGLVYVYHSAIFDNATPYAYMKAYSR